MTDTPFRGFTIETTKFFADLAANNTREWFSAHKSDYERFVLAPARDFVLTLGNQLRVLSPEVVADPRVDKSIFRIYRDIRFSKDKSPYKANLGLWFPVSGRGGKFENPGYYFHLEADNLMLGVGIHGFSKPLLKAYREAVVDADLGPDLAGISRLPDLAGIGRGLGTDTRTSRGGHAETSGYRRSRHGYQQPYYMGTAAGTGQNSKQDMSCPRR